MSSAIHLPKLVFKYISRKVRQMTYGQGMGRHTVVEVRSIANGDLTALSAFLGDKKFLMGDEPCETDCAIFGMLAQIKWHAPGTSLEKMINEELVNLSAYCDRVKERFWPDWDDCNTAGGTRTAPV